MVKNVIMIPVIGFIVFEFVEHVVFPVFWFIKNRNKRSISGMAGMLGRAAKVIQWDKTEGQVFVNGELWMAVSNVPLLKGDKVLVQEVEGLTLVVEPIED
jgi:membrane-bound serine protease (ClpP class)